MGAQKRLGRGLDALLGNAKKPATDATAQTQSAAAPSEIPVSKLTPGRYQPRRHIAKDNLEELANSIRQQGILQPLVVRPRTGSDSSTESHEIVAGERRWRAAQLAGLATVPVVIRDLDDQGALAVALIENLQREDLNPLEQAESLARLAEEFDLTHQQVAETVGRSRSSVSNLLRLLELHDNVKNMLAAGRIDMGHARALLVLAPEQQLRLAESAVANGLSVRQVETAVRKLQNPAPEARAPRATSDLQTRWLQRQLAKELGQNVSIRPSPNGGRRLSIEFDDLEQLQTGLRRVETLIGQVRATAGPRARNAEPKA